MCQQLNWLDTTNLEEISTQRRLTRYIAAFSVALMVLCLVPSTFAAQENGHKHDMRGMTHEKMNTKEPLSFSLDNATFEVQQERMLEHVNDTISMLGSDIENIEELENENITEEMLANAITQIEEAKTLITDAEDEGDLKEAKELIRSAMMTLGVAPENGHGMRQKPMDDQGISQGNESFETDQERMLQQINDTISFMEFSMVGAEELHDKNITAEMLENATIQLEKAKTIVLNAEDEEDLKEVRGQIQSAMEELGIGPEKREEWKDDKWENLECHQRKDLRDPRY